MAEARSQPGATAAGADGQRRRTANGRAAAPGARYRSRADSGTAHGRGRAASRSRPESLSAGLATRPVLGGPPTPYAARVLEVVERIPRGRVLTYGDVAEWLGSGSGRAVGAAMARHGHEVAWQRVVLASGHPAPSAPAQALELLADDGVALLSGGRVDLAVARWDGRPV